LEARWKEGTEGGGWTGGGGGGVSELRIAVSLCAGWRKYRIASDRIAALLTGRHASPQRASVGAIDVPREFGRGQ
jgi:hypothetical protein